ncbi:MAG: hypothetical protein KDB61_04305, partial [Planctomycetes bacterium]|nr:hypothetical protein [Planctomycetota bacterium]
GWPGSRRPPIQASRAWVAPFDSDFLYPMDLDRRALSPLAAPPTPIEQRMDLVSAGQEGLAFLGRRGRSETLWFEPVGEAPQYSFFLGRQEHLTGTVALTRDAWLFASTRGLYSIQPGRQFALAQFWPLPDLRAGVGGDVRVLGDRVIVLGEDTLWVLR